MALSGLTRTIADALIGIDTVWGGDVINPSGTGRFIADCWFSDEPLPRAYTHPAAAALRANGGAGAEKPDAASLSAYLAKVDVKGAIQLVLASAQEIGGLRGAHLEGLGLCCEVMLSLAMEIVGKGPPVPYERCVRTITGAPPNCPARKRNGVESRSCFLQPGIQRRARSRCFSLWTPGVSSAVCRRNRLRH